MYISPSAGDSGIGGIHLQNAGSLGYPSRQEFGRAFPGESGPPTRKKNKDTDIGDSARKQPANSIELPKKAHWETSLKFKIYQ